MGLDALKGRLLTLERRLLLPEIAVVIAFGKSAEQVAEELQLAGDRARAARAVGRRVVSIFIGPAVPVGSTQRERGLHMAVPNTSSRTDAVASGSTRTFTFNWKCPDAAWVQVLKGGVVQSSGYTVTLNANQVASPGGTVTFSSTPAAGTVVRIQRVVPLTRSTDYTASGAFPSATVNADMDKVLYIAQQADRKLADLSAGVEGVQGPAGPVGSVATAEDATISGNAAIGGNATIAGTLAVTGKATAAATEAGDGATTVATKGYVDATDGSAGLTWQSGWADYTGSSRGTRLWKQGNGVVTLALSAAASGTPTSYVVLLPGGYRPAVTVSTVGQDISSADFVPFIVNANGTVTVVAGTNGHAYAGILTFLAA